MYTSGIANMACYTPSLCIIKYIHVHVTATYLSINQSIKQSTLLITRMHEVTVLKYLHAQTILMCINASCFLFTFCQYLLLINS